MQQYLISESDSRNRIVGTDLVLPELDAARYKPEVRVSFEPQPDPFAKPVGDKPVERPAVQVRPVQPLTKNSDDLYKLTLPNVDKPGVYTFEFFPVADPGVKAETEVQAYAFNIDSAAESDLNRALEGRRCCARRPSAPASAGGGKVALRSPGDSFDDFKDPPPDLVQHDRAVPADRAGLRRRAGAGRPPQLPPEGERGGGDGGAGRAAGRRRKRGERRA